jgi:hypothetical protein
MTKLTADRTRGYIYGICRYDTHAVIYVGSTRQSIEERKAGHILTYTSGHRNKLYAYIERQGGFGEFYFKHLVELHRATRRDVLEAEARLFDEYGGFGYLFNSMRPVRRIMPDRLYMEHEELIDETA